MPKLGPQFFQQPTLRLAKELIGCWFIRVLGGETLKAIIVETEAYLAQDDPACHAAIGETKRNRFSHPPAGRGERSEGRVKCQLASRKSVHPPRAEGPTLPEGA